MKQLYVSAGEIMDTFVTREDDTFKKCFRSSVTGRHTRSAGTFCGGSRPAQKQHGIADQCLKPLNTSCLL
ncbi:uncharacterized [Tachysurus ichikawai]